MYYLVLIWVFPVVHGPTQGCDLKTCKCRTLVHSHVSLKGLGHVILGNFVEFCQLWALNVKLAEQESFICQIKATLQLRMIFPLCKWYFDINWHKFEKRWADVFQIYPNAIHLNPLQFCPSMPLLGFPVFCLSSSIVLNRYFHILVNSMTIWSVLKLPKIAWPSPFKQLSKRNGIIFSKHVLCCIVFSRRNIPSWSADGGITRTPPPRCTRLRDPTKNAFRLRLCNLFLAICFATFLISENYL